MGTGMVERGQGSLAKPPAETALDWTVRGLAGVASSPTPRAPHSLAEPVALGHELVAWIQGDLPLLKPKMRHVAEHLLLHRTTLHRQGIQQLAQQTRTAPATVVRLAKRYGFAGFSDLKIAFLALPQAGAEPGMGMANTPTSAPTSAATPPVFGNTLVERIRQDLPRLSPKMRNVGEHLLRYSSSLHRQRIKVLARQADTIPATIVRLAKRYGFTGFHDLKLAFLPPATQPLSPEAHAALSEIDRMLVHLQSIRSLVEQVPFQELVQALHSATQIRVCATQEADQALASYLRQRLTVLRPDAALDMQQAEASQPPCVVLEVRLSGPRPWLCLQSGHTPLADTAPLTLAISDEAEAPTYHGAFALVDALCAALAAVPGRPRN